MTLLLAGSAIAVAALLLLTGPRRTDGAVDTAAMGWTPSRLSLANWALVGVGVGLAGMLGLSSSPAEGFAYAVLAGLWLPWVMPALLVLTARASYRAERDKHVLEWFRKMRLLAASGHPVNSAAVHAAMTIRGRGFASVRGRISSALSVGRDPLDEMLKAVAGSPTEPMLQSVLASERAGAAATSLLDGALARTVRAFEADRRNAIDRLGRTIGLITTLSSVVSGMTVMMAAFSTI